MYSLFSHNFVFVLAVLSKSLAEGSPAAIMDVHFRLLRQDFVEPLREAVLGYLSEQTKSDVSATGARLARLGCIKEAPSWRFHQAIDCIYVVNSLGCPLKIVKLMNRERQRRNETTQKGDPSWVQDGYSAPRVAALVWALSYETCLFYSI